MKIFVSLPMSGMAIDDIRDKQMQVAHDFSLFNRDEPIILVETAIDRGDVHRIYNLGQSISKMPEADAIIFMHDDFTLRSIDDHPGCTIEKYIALLYGLKSYKAYYDKHLGRYNFMDLGYDKE